ncbi:MAG TPA: DUF5655 domain-containing protein [Candidatus Limnocylindria bacterium]|nr:DUF5655 domain-containing protein [Candidatus Limnocylindria bacterium]
MTARARPLWRCPKCGRTFVTPNMSHSCRRLSVGDHLEGKPPEILALYEYLHHRIRQIGPVTIDPPGRAIVFQVRARSIGLTPKAKWVDLTLWLKRDVTHPRVRKIDDYGSLGRILHFRLTSEDDVDAPLVRLLEEAYAVGAQRPVTTRASRPSREDARRAR